MALKIICSGYLIRYPVGGFSPHHLQYLLGFQRLGHEVVYFEHYGWADSCFDPAQNVMTADPCYGIAYFRALLDAAGVSIPWCYIAENGGVHGLPRQELADACRECDVYFNLSNINWIPETLLARCRVLIDTDPIFTQIKAHGLGGRFDSYDALFTFGQNVHEPGCTMPTAGQRWRPTRQPIVLDLWPCSPGAADGPLTTLMNWSAYGEHRQDGRVYGQKDREFEPYMDLPKTLNEHMEIATRVPSGVRDRLVHGGWEISDPCEPNASLTGFQHFVRRSAAEFSVAKHAYVVTGSGWFSDRSAAYLAMGRPVILQDTGFSRVLPCGLGLLSFGTRSEAIETVRSVRANYESHCRAAREMVETYFASDLVLTDLLEQSLNFPKRSMICGVAP